MTFVEAIKSCLSKYATFSGRASRSEFWWFYLFFVLCEFVAPVIDNMLGTTFKFTNSAPSVPPGVVGGYVYLLLVLGLFLPSISVSVRRLHDTDRSGWWWFIALVPFVGIILLLIWWCLRGTPGPNRFGDDPLSEGLAEVFS